MKREACKDITSVSKENIDDRKQCEEETIMKGEANVNTTRNDVPVQRVLKAEPVEKISSEQMEKRISDKRPMKLEVKRIERRNQPVSDKIKTEMNWVLERRFGIISEAGIKPARARAATALALATAAATALH